MDFAHWLVILSALIGIAGVSIYIRDTLIGKTKPNRVSYFMWALAPFIATAAALSAHADMWATVRIFLGGFFPFLVFVASFINPQSYWKLTLFDFVCGACALFALAVWGIVGSPQTAILFAAIGDGFASIPTLVKAWKHPETETGLSYAASFVSVLLVIPSIPRWDIENSAFQVYLFLCNGLLFLVVYRRHIGKLFLR